VFGRPYAELPHAALRIGAVLEATDFHPGRSGREHLRMLGKAVDVPDLAPSSSTRQLKRHEISDAAAAVALLVSGVLSTLSLMAVMAGGALAPPAAAPRRHRSPPRRRALACGHPRPPGPWAAGTPWAGAPPGSCHG
jgi:hypothetical protein